MSPALKFCLLLGTAVLLSCATGQKQNAAAHLEVQDDRPINQQYSIKADREELEQVRSSVPEATRIQNDELALVLKLMEGERHSPSEVRSRFNKALRRKQTQFREDMRKARTDFNTRERSERRDFLKRQDEGREEFKASASGGNRDARSSFYDGQDAQRKKFFAEARDQRRNFEAEHAQKRKDFADYVKERRSFFNDEMKLYELRYKAAKKERKEKKNELKQSLRKETFSPGQPKGPSQAEIKDFLKEFEELPPQPAGRKLNQ